jgi:peptide/nickel transport system ATP-binding protein
VREVIKEAQHPYTKGLMGSIPSLGQRSDRLTQIDGSMPRLTAIPEGCAFNPRCTFRGARCLIERPDLIPAGASRAACWQHDRKGVGTPVVSELVDV